MDFSLDRRSRCATGSYSVVFPIFPFCALSSGSIHSKQPRSPPVLRASSPIGVRPRAASVPRSQLSIAKTPVLHPAAKGISIQDDPSLPPQGSFVQVDSEAKGKGPMSEPELKKLRKL